VGSSVVGVAPLPDVVQDEMISELVPEVVCAEAEAVGRAVVVEIGPRVNAYGSRAAIARAMARVGGLSAGRAYSCRSGRGEDERRG